MRRAMPTLAALLLVVGAAFAAQGDRIQWEPVTTGSLPAELVTQTEGDARYLLLTSKGAALGVAELNGAGVVPAGQVPVPSVFGRTSAVTAQTGDYTATQITSTATGDVVAETVQAALAEMASEKLASATAASTYATQIALASYLTTANAASTYSTLTHAARHATGQADAVSPASIGALSSVSTTGSVLSGAGTAGSPLTVGSGAIAQDRLGSLSLGLGSMSWRPKRYTVTLELAQTVANLPDVVAAAFYPGVRCSTAGLDREYVASAPGVLQYAVAESGGVTQVTWGVAPGNVLMICDYFY